MIPTRLIRTVPAETSDQVEDWWRQACRLHPGWQHVTLRDPVDRTQFPVTSPYWDGVESGAQLADLIRIEELWARGGVYIDSDVEVFRSFEPLLCLPGFAGWEDEKHIPNAVLGFRPAHLALRKVLELAIRLRHQGTWNAGVGVTTQVFKDRTDILLLPPGSLYPVHYRARMPSSDTVRADNPWAFCLHHWAHSWASV